MKRAGAAILAAMTICASHAAFAQAPPVAAPAPQGRGGASPAASVISPAIAADRKVTFRIYAPNAQAVRLAAARQCRSQEGAQSCGSRREKTTA